MAFRKRSARTVTFADPTYVEASEIEYSTEDEGDPEFYSHLMNQGVSTEYRSNTDDDDNDGSSDQELHGNQWVPNENDLVSTETDVNFVTEDSDNLKANDELLYGRNESKIRNGVLRNTDSFFQDDSVETRKITLTPNLLRDSSSPPAAVVPNEPKETRRPSLEKPEKNSPDRSRDKKERKDKREKDKKTGKLSGLFKRKDKKNKSIDEEIEELSSMKHTDSSRNSPAPSKDSDEMVNVEEQANAILPETQKLPNKLQKQPTGKRSLSQGMEIKGPESASNSPSETVQSLSTTLSLRLVQSDSSTNVLNTQAQLVSPERSITPTLKEHKLDNSIRTLGQSQSFESSTKEATNAIESRKKSSEIDFTINSPVDTSKSNFHQTSRSQASSNATEVHRNGSLSQVKIPDTTRPKLSHQILAKDNSSQSEPSSPLSSSSESIYREESPQKKDGRRQITTLTSKAWSDAHLKTFFDDNTDIKDLLIVVYDKSGVVPAGPEHPIVGNLFKEENSKLLEITNRLDGMLGDWLARKTRIRHERKQIL
ncbi:unnamed protein product [Blumeria hordei]|uniref:Uncharacterized protein n=1 Tax=Blumeria hordei TaxID=2867405 RepID=A0A383URM2_BLUHO|nr:unnamed protein product [Blumeria hordei]